MFCIIYSGKCSPFIKKLQTPANQIMNQNGACWFNFLCWQMMIICLTICGSIIRRTRKLNGREGNWKPEGWVVAGVSYHCEIRNLKNHCGKCDICMFWCLYWNVKRCERYNFQNLLGGKQLFLNLSSTLDFTLKGSTFNDHDVIANQFEKCSDWH